MKTLFGEIDTDTKTNYIRNPAGHFERKSVKKIYDKEINSLRTTIRVMYANRESVYRQLRVRDEEIQRLNKIIAQNGLK